MPSIELRKEIVREIRRAQPDRMVIQSPERNYERIFASHPDHLVQAKQPFKPFIQILETHMHSQT